MKKCIQCGFVGEDSDDFCPQCGNALQNSEEQDLKQPKGTKKIFEKMKLTNRYFILGLCGILIILCGCGMWYFFTQMENSRKDDFLTLAKPSVSNPYSGPKRAGELIQEDDSKINIDSDDPNSYKESNTDTSEVSTAIEEMNSIGKIDSGEKNADKADSIEKSDVLSTETKISDEIKGTDKIQGDENTTDSFEFKDESHIINIEITPEVIDGLSLKRSSGPLVTAAAVTYETGKSVSAAQMALELGTTEEVGTFAKDIAALLTKYSTATNHPHVYEHEALSGSEITKDATNKFVASMKSLIDDDKLGIIMIADRDTSGNEYTAFAIVNGYYQNTAGNVISFVLIDPLSEGMNSTVRPVSEVIDSMKYCPDFVYIQ